MNNKKRILIPSIFAILVGAIALFALTHGQGPPEGLDVTIVNTPLPVTGTIVGTSDVNVTNAVQVDDSTPITVNTNLDIPVRQPFHVPKEHTDVDGSIAGFPAMFNVPASKRAVIEYVSARLILPVGQNITQIIFESRAPDGQGGEVFAQQFLHPTFKAAFSSGTHQIFVSSQQTRFYANPGTVISIYFFRSSNAGTFDVEWAISGHLVDVDS